MCVNHFLENAVTAHLGVHVSGPIVGRAQHVIAVLVLRRSPDGAVVAPLEGEGALVPAIRPFRWSEIPAAKSRQRNTGDEGGECFTYRINHDLDHNIDRLGRIPP